MREGICDHPEVENLMAELAVKLETVSGKKSYGYLPKPVKKIVDEIVDQMERIPSVSDCYNHWLELQNQVDSYYGGYARKRLKLSQQKEFRAVKNAVIQEAERIRLGELSFEDADVERQDEPEEELEVGYSFWRVVDDIYDETLLLEERDAAVDELRVIAEEGEPYAQYYLGKLYRDGGLLIPDSQLAADWFYKAARQDMVVAQYALGKLFLMGREVRQDRELALYWLTRSANQGNEYAQFFIDRAGSFRPLSVMLAATRLLHHMANIFRDNSLPRTGMGGIQIDRKRLQKLREKKIALGHRPDDYEEYTGPTLSM